ncbi:hypothetical protein GCM10023238_13100 [Streptomyces heliomycini]
MFREFMRHRVGWSYNEESGRYRGAAARLLRPDASRKLVQEGRPGKYVFVEGTPAQHETVQSVLGDSYHQPMRPTRSCWPRGSAREVARAGTSPSACTRRCTPPATPAR